MATNDPLISLRSVGVAYRLKGRAFGNDQYWALSDVTLDVHRGEALGIIGRNGCGKSTLLRVLAGIMCPDRGEVVGADAVRASLLSLQVGFMPHLTGRENAILSGMFLGMRHHEVRKRMEKIIEFSDLGPFIDQPISTYSSGMRARLGFAVAFQLDPDILLVDEVTGVGDRAFRERSFQMMKDRIQNESNTVVFVSHMAAQVRDLCDRAIWIDAGTVRASGEVDDVLRAYEGRPSPRPQDAAKGGPPSDAKPEPKPCDRTFARLEGKRVIYEVQAGKRRRLSSTDEFRELGGRFEDVHVLPEEVFVALQEVRAFPCADD